MTVTIGLTSSLVKDENNAARTVKNQLVCGLAYGSKQRSSTSVFKVDSVNASGGCA